MLEENFPENNLIVTGHPYLDKIFNYDLNECYDNSNPDLKRFLFLSQPLNVIGAIDYKIHLLEALLDAMKILIENRGEEISFIIKLHPTEENSEELNSIISCYNKENLRVEYSNKTRLLEELIKECEVVIGYNSIALFESRALNKRTISILGGRVKQSLLNAMGEAGIEIVNANQKDIYNCLISGNENILIKRDKSFTGGIENCVNVILEELNLN
jgi:hypothetical protein